MKQLTVLFFALLKDQIGASSLDILLVDTATVKDLKAELGNRFPRAEVILSRSIASVNQEFAFDEDLLPDGADVALFPPVSGGDYPTIYRILEGPLDLDDLVSQITLPSTGAVCVFTGIVRGITSRGEAHVTTRLEYEAYVPMAEAKMKQVAGEIRNQWPSVEGIVIVQRIGVLDPGTPTVLIACSAAHRDTGVFEAARFGIDRLKEIVPVWKKEIGPDGIEWIEGKYHPDRKDRDL
jgi:molybdopterin synthase catalytic subunit